MFTALTRVAADMGVSAGQIDVLFKKIVSNPACVIQVDNSLPEESSTAVVSSGNHQFRLSLAPDEVAGVVSRVAYDEAAICDGAVINGNRISLATLTHDDDIETLVALCKRLHLEHLDNQRKWVFSRYRGRFPLALSSTVSISIVKTVGNKLTCSEVVSAGVKIGEIFFS
ncbi:hypothetical protein [Pseudomonas sediminis]|uniref:Uncharacterized protein n=1 Tax=Pseudomonas sediminis TaxID=1691904 RepID=A0ABX6SD14_9PSED|nr:hypothetical protein [Pseudomonas sediminis]QNG99602.1 hypothetical protein HNQ25_14975 [Pseudomonas sediminis]